ncbi:polymeric immunoglobulin receptor-like [Colossoma macropomum]|uniref:polymeric immunoglobulin receptor-like n=1 Tax=Colossoma macropomum TaxID=42526 RepID=UPI0018654164|nr:polymeric immunoglobulin receptor-like [Colossoma macropomum]
MDFHSLMRSLILFVLLLCISDSESMKTLKNLAVKRGGSLSIPCFYDEKYKSNIKYWCKGEYWSSCEIVAYTDTSGRTSVTDHPTQNMFTVELKSLQDSDSGYYWCAVEIGGTETPDDRDYLYLTVSADPAVSVINSRVSGQEGGSVSVQCLYSAEHQKQWKKWCRFTDWSCYKVGRTDTSQNSAVLVNDDWRGSINVEMRGLQKSDAGWYWFKAGDVGVTVHLTVTEKPSSSTPVSRNKETTTAELTTNPPAVTASENEHGTSKSGKMQDNRRSDPPAVTAFEKGHDTNNSEKNQDNNGSTVLIWVLLAVGLGLLLFLTIIITCMLRKKCNGNQTETRGRVNNTSVDTTPMTESSVIHSTVIHKNKKLSQSVGDDEVIYSSVVLK